jgi:hypothetical protein
MAESHAHRLGQIIGDCLESTVEPFLRKFANEHSLYFDKKERRPARSGTKLTWIDINDNKHDLDFVLEKNGTSEKIGIPAAFIECAWRRYTKHSRNKVQEIQGAILPLFDKYKKCNPFIGVILAGEFTENSLTQLKSLGFSILYFSYEKIINAFRISGIDVSFREDTKEVFFAKQVKLWEKLPESRKTKIYKEIVKQNHSEINLFITELTKKITRKIITIRIWIMFGKEYVFNTIEKAREFIVNVKIDEISPHFCEYEAEIEYSNSDMIKIRYHNQNDMLNFLSSYI